MGTFDITCPLADIQRAQTPLTVFLSVQNLCVNQVLQVLVHSGLACANPFGAGTATLRALSARTGLLLIALFTTCSS
ncbi:MAG: hypothetical protein HON35_03095 [Actinobacteria bacterium]|nr:hypothetical protein [Actinomycetota bacterium]